MPTIRYDRLITDEDASSKTKQTRHRWLPDDLNFDEWIVDYLLDRYHLAGTRTKFCLMDISKESGWSDASDGPFAPSWAFRILFPDFPLRFSSILLNKTDRDRISVARFFLKLDKIAVLSPVWTEVDEFYADAEQPALACVLGGLIPRLPIEDVLTIHTWLPMNPDSEGTHMVYTTSGGHQVGVERLGTLLDAVEEEVDPKQWQETAIRQDFRVLLADD